MYELIEIIKEIGNISLDTFWFPLFIWTVCCAVTFLYLKTRDKLNPLFHYHLRTAAILALPLGIAIAAFMSKIPEWFASSNLETAFFVVQNPIEIVPAANLSSAEIVATQWQEPSFFIGAATLFIAIISVFMIGRLISSYVALKSLYKNLVLTDLQEVTHENGTSYKARVKLAFHDHPLVPFTFGWKQPVIVLPKILRHEPEKLNMALQHELIHIKRGDYLLQLALSMIETLFWFHPLIRYGNQEIDTYREISCDQEVLSKSGFSIKSYASLLYELVPLSTGVGKLSVSMAVKKSTLKKRIKTMKYHKLYQHSFKQSIVLLILLVVGITLPVACSDMRGSSALSPEELENSTFQVSNAVLSINGLNLDVQYNSRKGTNGLGALIIYTGKYGTFKLAPWSFEGAVKAGHIEGNRITFTFNQLNVVVQSDEEILTPAGKAELWVKYTDLKTEAAVIVFTPNASTLIPPPPPLAGGEIISPEEPGNEGLNAPDAPEDFFVVVEEMPKLIGGVQGLQSRIQYPKMARNAGIEGKVIIQFIVNEDGKVENPKIIQGIGGGCDEEALRLVKNAEFNPGKQRGRNVRVQFALSVNFSLSKADFAKEQEN